VKEKERGLREREKEREKEREGERERNLKQEVKQLRQKFREVCVVNVLVGNDFEQRVENLC